MQPVLLLNADYAPMKIIGWQRSVELILMEKAVAVENLPGRFVRSPSLALPWPAVLSLRRYAQVRGRVRFSSRNVVARDAFTCQYCGFAPRSPEGRPDRSLLTMDHVIPRARSRHGAVYLPWSRRWVNLTSWENTVAACRPCNGRKGARNPKEAGMLLRHYPRVPTTRDVLRLALLRLGHVPPIWLPYIPEKWHVPAERVPARTAEP